MSIQKTALFLILLFLVSIGNATMAEDEYQFTDEELKKIDEFLDSHRSSRDAPDIAQTTAAYNYMLLHRAVEGNRDIAVIRFLVSQGVDVNAKNVFGRTALYFVLNRRKPNIEIAEFLVSKGADVDSEGKQLLYFAVINGNLESAQFLVSKGANVNATVDSSSLLHEAAFRGDHEMVKLLISAGANVHAKDDHGLTPIDSAVGWYANGNLEVIKTLVSAGIDIPDYALFPAAAQQRVEIVEFLVAQGFDVNPKTEHGFSPLHNAVRSSARSRDNLETAAFLISKGADVNAKSKDGVTPLHRVNENWQTAELLIAKGADVNAKTKDGVTPLHIAASYTYVTDVVKILIAKGADVNAKTEDGSTPLHRVGGNWQTAELLISKGADVHAKDKDGRTPLHLAVLATYIDYPEDEEPYEIGVDVVKFLVSQGANVHAKNNDGKTPLDLAEKNKKETIEFLTEAQSLPIVEENQKRNVVKRTVRLPRLIRLFPALRPLR